jgi:hypothetical protein
MDNNGRATQVSHSIRAQEGQGPPGSRYQSSQERQGSNPREVSPPAVSSRQRKSVSQVSHNDFMPRDSGFDRGGRES